MFDVIKYGCIWHRNRIKEELEKIISSDDVAFECEIRRDDDDEFHCIYQNECYLFIKNGAIELRCDRPNEEFESMSDLISINSAADVQAVFARFKDWVNDIG